MHALAERDVSHVSLMKAMASTAGPEMTEEIMDSSFEMILAKRRERAIAKYREEIGAWDMHDSWKKCLVESFAKGFTESFTKSFAKEREQREVEAKAEGFLMLARYKFGQVPEDREAQVRAACVPQLDNWLLRMPRAPSLDLVFDEDRGMTQGEAKARSEAKAEDFLILARSKFGRVPDHVEKLVRTASVPQIEYWLPRILTAASLNAVFDEDAGNGQAVNEVPARSPRRKREAN